MVKTLTVYILIEGDTSKKFDWNEEFQSLVSKYRTSVQNDLKETSVKLNLLIQNFMNTTKVLRFHFRHFFSKSAFVKANWCVSSGIHKL
jgi:hypothetical protein